MAVSGVSGVHWMTVYQVYVGVLVKLSWGGYYNQMSNMVESK